MTSEQVAENIFFIAKLHEMQMVILAKALERRMIKYTTLSGEGGE